jgi:hypothetical protein
MAADRKPILLRLDPAVYDALARWAADELRSTNAQIEMVLRRALAEAGRLPSRVAPLRGPGRPRKSDSAASDRSDRGDRGDRGDGDASEISDARDASRGSGKP